MNERAACILRGRMQVFRLQLLIAITQRCSSHMIIVTDRPTVDRHPGRNVTEQLCESVRPPALRLVSY